MSVSASGRKAFVSVSFSAAERVLLLCLSGVLDTVLLEGVELTVRELDGLELVTRELIVPELVALELVVFELVVRELVVRELVVRELVVLELEGFEPEVRGFSSAEERSSPPPEELLPADGAPADDADDGLLPEFDEVRRLSAL